MKLFWGSTLFLVLIIFSPWASAQTDWVGIFGGGDGTTFENQYNWDNGVPTSMVPANIYLNANITLSSAQSVQTLTINGENAVILTAGAGDSLTVAGETPTLTDEGDLLIDEASSLTFGGGALNLTEGVITVGDGGGVGTLNLTSGTLNYDFQTNPQQAFLYVGNSGQGTVNQSGNSTVTSGYNLIIGQDGGTGNYTLSGTATLQTGSTQTTGNYFIAVGSNTSASETTAGTVGTLTVSGNSTLIVGATGMLQLGTTGAPLGGGAPPVGTVGGTGYLIQNGAGSNVDLEAGSLSAIGTFSGGVGTYYLESGTLTMSGNSVLEVGNGTGTIGVLNQSGGTFNADASSAILFGYNGTGTYALSGGNATLLNGFNVGGIAATSGSGFVNQTGGNLITGQTAVANSGVAVGGATGTASGVYSLSGGTSTMNGGLVVGATGTIDQSGGIMTITSGQLLNLNATGATYNLDGGILQVDNGGLTGTGSLNGGGGTLQITSAGAFTDPLSGTLTGGITTFDGSSGTVTSITIADSLSGVGGIRFLGSGPATAFSFGSNNTYSGPTVIQEGTLTANFDQIGSSNLFDIVDGNSVLNFSTVPAGVNRLNAVLAGAGTFNANFTTVNDTIELASIGANTFTGTIDLGYNGNAGTLQVFSGSFGAINDEIAGVPATSSGSGVTIGGDTSVANSGIVNFTQNETYTGLTTVSSGFILNALGLAGSATNNGTLYANNIGGNVINTGLLGTPVGSNLQAATLSTSISPTLTIGGNLVSSGTLIFRTTGSTTDYFQVNGVAPSNLTGSSAKISGYGSTGTIVNGVFTPSPVVVINAPAGLTSTTPPTTVVSGAHVLFNGSLLENAQDTQILLTTTQLGTASFAQTPNQLAVAHAIDPLLVVNGLPGNVTAALDNLTAAQIPVALDELTPEVLQYSRDIAFENSTFLMQQVNGALANVRAGYEGIDASGISIVSAGFNTGLGQSLNSLLAYNPPSFNQPAPNGVNYYPQSGGYSPSTSPSPSSSPGSSARSISDSPNPDTTVPPTTLSSSEPDFKGPVMSEFLLGNVVLADMNQNLSAPNAAPDRASYTASSATAGISFRMTSNLAAGVLFNYNHTDAKTDSNSSKTTVDSYSPGVYATWFDKGFYVNGIFSYGFNSYQNTRRIPVFTSTATSAPSGEQADTDLDFGYDFQPKSHPEWVFGPTLGLTYTHLDVDSFTEQGAGPADLTVSNQDLNSLRSRLGGHVVYQARSGSLLFQPNFSAMWQHEYLNNPGITSQLNIPGTGPFTIQTATTGKDSALLGAGLTVTLDNSMAFYVDYLADVGQDDFFAQSIVGGFKASF